jgi:hypothetical protein
MAGVVRQAEGKGNGRAGIMLGISQVTGLPDRAKSVQG